MQEVVSQKKQYQKQMDDGMKRGRGRRRIEKKYDVATVEEGAPARWDGGAAMTLCRRFCRAVPLCPLLLLLISPQQPLEPPQTGRLCAADCFPPSAPTRVVSVSPSSPQNPRETVVRSVQCAPGNRMDDGPPGRGLIRFLFSFTGALRLWLFTTNSGALSELDWRGSGTSVQ